MWDPENKLIRFITDVDFSDPSYHLPHFHELYSLYSDEDDKDFWRQAADASRKALLRPKKIILQEVTALIPVFLQTMTEKRI